jgi:hypothetical protein
LIFVPPEQPVAGSEKLVARHSPSTSEASFSQTLLRALERGCLGFRLRQVLLGACL